MQRIASTFKDLQEARHGADYNLEQTFTRSETKELISRVQTAFADWATLRGSPETQLFLLLLLFNKRWNR